MARRDVPSVLLLCGAALSAGLIGWQVFGKAHDAEWLYLWPFHPLGLFAAIAWILVDRLVESLRHSEQLNLELEQRVETKHAELERQYARTRELEHQQTVTAERARIMSDMHDGIGGHFISTLSLVENQEASRDEISAALRERIDDLRLAIDSLEPTEEDLLTVLGNLRYRLEPRLSGRGIQLDWQVCEVPRLACLTPQNVLHILRILQEAFTNVLKHAQATCIRVSTAIDSKRVSIRCQRQRSRLRRRAACARKWPQQHAKPREGDWR